MEETKENVNEEIKKDFESLPSRVIK